ncbi:MAG: MotA/TolQ/ExbB proton channel family protein [Proteobacteria bacterium]|nr:MotA/TolQ/ExbB proton channel family protein [Pseudomonadota bacterium]
MADAGEVAGSVSIGAARTQLDLATVIGLVAGFGLVAAALVLGGAPGAFVDIPSVLIVIIGTLSITMVSYSLTEMLRAGKLFMKTMFFSGRDASEAAMQVLQLAEIARKSGVLSLQNVLEDLKSEQFLYKGISLVVDGTPGEEVEVIMRRDMNSTLARHQRSAGIMRRAAEVSPAMGLIGTLIGLVQMLGNLEDPSSIGPSMAVALLTTFYGAVMANMLFLPLAAKLDRNSQEEALTNSVFLMGAASIGRQENPRRLEMLINSVLPPAKRVSFFE